MLAWESVVEAKALRARGWSISAIARHLQINRRTVRRYLSDEATVGVRRPAGPDGFEPFAGYARAGARNCAHGPDLPLRHRREAGMIRRWRCG